MLGLESKVALDLQLGFSFQSARILIHGRAFQIFQRRAGGEIARPICDLGVVMGDVTVDCCGTTVVAKLKRREKSDGACPLYGVDTMDGATLCGCAARDYLRSLQGGEPIV